MRFVSCGAVAVVIAIASPAAAQLQSLSGQLSAGAGVTDNANLEEDAEAVGDGFSQISPGLIYIRRGLRAIHSFAYRFDAQLYFEHSEANSYSNQLSWDGLFLLAPRLRMRLLANVSQGESNNFQLVSDQPGLEAAPNGGVAFISTAVGQGFTYEASQSLTLDESLLFRTSFPLDTDEQSRAYDISNVLTGDKAWQRSALGARYRTTLFVSEEETDAEGMVTVPGQKQIITGPEIIGRRDIGEAWGAELALGGIAVFDVEADAGPVYQPTVAAAIRFTTQRGSVRAGYNRNATPNLLVGEVFLNDQVDVGADYPLLVEERVFLRGTVGAIRARRLLVSDEGDEIGDTGMVYLADAAIAWQAMDNLALNLRYTFRKQTSDDVASIPELTANTVLLSVSGSYPPLPREGRQLRSATRVDKSDSPDPFEVDKPRKPPVR